MMNRSYLFLIFLLPCFICNGQSLYSYSLSNFRELKVFNQAIDVDSFKPEILNAAIFWVTNEIRVSHNLSELSYAESLQKSASIHSADMAKYNFFDHTNTKNKKRREPSDRAKLAGIKNPFIAENIIEGFIYKYTSGDEVVIGNKGEFFSEDDKPLPLHSYLSLADNLLEQWMLSPGHRNNILSEKAIQLGCGTALFYMKDFNDMPAVKATQNFQWFEKVQN